MALKAEKKGKVFTHLQPVCNSWLLAQQLPNSPSVQHTVVFVRQPQVVTVQVSRDAVAPAAGERGGVKGGGAVQGCQYSCRGKVGCKGRGGGSTDRPAVPRGMSTGQLWEIQGQSNRLQDGMQNATALMGRCAVAA